jgi:hypothetical protein
MILMPGVPKTADESQDEGYRVKLTWGEPQAEVGATDKGLSVRFKAGDPKVRADAMPDGEIERPAPIEWLPKSKPEATPEGVRFNVNNHQH